MVMSPWLLFPLLRAVLDGPVSGGCYRRPAASESRTSSKTAALKTAALVAPQEDRAMQRGAGG